jgi:uncharacterized 2Fe-2S/4Fe-4S cluster protein (DUF4445 family)
MPIVTIFPFNKSLEVDAGTTLANVIRRAGFTLRASCGDMGTCGECLVKVISGKYDIRPAAGLCSELIREGYTLACSSEVKDDIVIEVPYYQNDSMKTVYTSEYFEKYKDRISGKYNVNPLIKVYELTIPAPTLDDNYSDLKRVRKELEKILTGKIDFEYQVLKKIAVELRKDDHKLFLVVFENNDYNLVIDISSEHIIPYGLSIDVGTTTVAVQVVNLVSGEVIDTGAGFNKQISCGADVISRINYAQKEGKLKELHELIMNTINEITVNLCDTNKVLLNHIFYSVISGNTTMIHLLLDIEPRFIREEPYVPTVNEVPFLKFSEIGMAGNINGKVSFSPCVGSYVGGDITAGLLCTPILKDNEKNYLFIDVGTNGELVLGNHDWLVTCACSAGPAFEGSGTSCGMPAMNGAIEKIEFKSGKIFYNVIGDDKPRGICGSGMLDLLAELLVNGYIDRFGKFHDDICGDRLINIKNGKSFVVVNSQNSETNNPVYISENDIANLIRTKGAIFSAISLLIKNVGLSFEDIDTFFIAGGFGKHLNIESCIKIGLFPDIDRDKFYYIGNSSLLGSYLTLICDTNRELLQHLSNKITYMELNTEPDYMNEYTGALFLPHTNLTLFPTIEKLLQ